MFRRKPETKPSTAHTSAARPRAAVDIDLGELSAGSVATAPDSGWLESSQDLERGARVRETPLHSLSPELIAAFLRRPQ